MYEAGEEGDLAYIAMEYLHGRDLAAFTKPDNLLPLPSVLSILARVAEALACAHRNSVVHRDVKPANVIYEPVTDLVKVMDFGVARLTDASKTKTGMVLGSPSYMSPEQLLGRKVDGRSDLFSLGVMLYQLACGRLPFVAESMGRLMYKITNEPAPDVRSVNPQVPDDVVTVIERAMSKSAEQRYQTADEMARDLRACLDRLRQTAVDGEAGKQGK
jgi:serine/threonine-protein kinase